MPNKNLPDEIQALIDICKIIDARLDAEMKESDGEMYILAAIHQDLKDRIKAVEKLPLDKSAKI